MQAWAFTKRPRKMTLNSGTIGEEKGGQLKVTKHPGFEKRLELCNKGKKDTDYGGQTLSHEKWLPALWTGPALGGQARG